MKRLIIGLVPAVVLALLIGSFEGFIIDLFGPEWMVVLGFLLSTYFGFWIIIYLPKFLDKKFLQKKTS